jgi:hypothetical protein
VAKNTLKKYFAYLEAAVLIHRLYRIDANARHFQRAGSFKVYLANPSMRSALFGLDGEDGQVLGHLVENALVSQCMHGDQAGRLHYARWKEGRQDREVDLVSLHAGTQKPEWFLEVKWSDKQVKEPARLAGLFAFHARNDSGRIPIVTTKTIHGVKTFEEATVNFIPCALLIYGFGKDRQPGVKAQ